MTRYRTSGDRGDADWRGDVAWKWGDRTLNLPVDLSSPGNWAAHLTRFAGTGVWDWQDHQANIAGRAGDESVTYRPVTQITLPPVSAAFVFDTLPTSRRPRRHLSRAGR